MTLKSDRVEVLTEQDQIDDAKTQGSSSDNELSSETRQYNIPRIMTHELWLINILRVQSYSILHAFNMSIIGL